MKLTKRQAEFKYERAKKLILDDPSLTPTQLAERLGVGFNTANGWKIRAKREMREANAN